ncbi:hypothetical protein GGTG_07030 [Gaeumannomyces tritici R3-111a-1]|uniref:Uncharacterized protein n=1 Tax=Gaeumannomyces tritici (strain R3-111a-1) TaxID=644352 RepID=J3P0I5_GAET3|nr:hypothetical protein GGTG_07030 [Gaeumannomyces tritici R3-111a-1]EJT77118.1 hypothetical protein GGTG_07030 [Gaeumannomyces tritici R3-111a-1]
MRWIPGSKMPIRNAKDHQPIPARRNQPHEVPSGIPPSPPLRDHWCLPTRKALQQVCCGRELLCCCAMCVVGLYLADLVPPLGERRLGWAVAASCLAVSPSRLASPSKPLPIVIHRATSV